MMCRELWNHGHSRGTGITQREERGRKHSGTIVCVKGAAQAREKQAACSAVPKTSRNFLAERTTHIFLLLQKGLLGAGGRRAGG